MKTAKINYYDFLKYTVDYLNAQNPPGEYYFSEISRWYDDNDEPCSARYVYGFIAKERPLSEKSKEMLRLARFGDEHERARAKEYLLAHDIVACYCIDDHTDILRVHLRTSKKNYEFKPVFGTRYKVGLDDPRLFESINLQLGSEIVSSYEQQVLSRKPRLFRQ